MRILIVMGGFFPGRKFGGPPVSVDNFCSLMRNFECYIVTYDHDLGDTTRYFEIDRGWNDRENCKVLYLPDTEYNKTVFEKVINEIKPDVLYLQGLFQSCVFPCLQLAKKYGLKVLLAPRGELCTGALKIKRNKKLAYICVVRILELTKNIHWQSTSDEETDAIKKFLGVGDANIHRLNNIPSIPKKEYSNRDKVSGEGRFVFLSRIHPKKNLLLAIKSLSESQGKVWLDVYGPIEDEEYWEQCQDEIKKLPNNIKAEYKGLIRHEKVHDVLSQYDAFLFPTFSENYGHVISESLIVGTPVIISDQTPWRGLVSAGAGWDIALNNVVLFKKAIQTVVDMNNEQMKRARKSAKAFVYNQFEMEKLRQDYQKVLSGI